MAETTLDPMANVAQLRQQLRSRLQGNLAQGQDVLTAYQEAYPDLDVRTIQGALTPQPMYGVNIHGRPTDLSPAWIAEQTIEPVEFGSLADPVSQLAFLAAPGALRAGKQALETVARPGPSRLSALAGERGNLGPVPRSQQGVPLPESAVRDEAGQLKRLYHGTGKVYPDFEMAKAGSGAGGDLYGPGIYLTESPQIAGDYAALGMPGGPGSPAAIQSRLDYARTQRLIAAKARAAGKSDVAEAYEQVAQSAEDQAAHLFGTVKANVRPVYADLKRPFDIEAPADAGIIKKLDEYGWDYYLTPRGEPDIPTNKELYNVLLRNLGDKSEVNDWLAANGFDGITHMGGIRGGQPHQVYIAFSPEQVYPSVNVEGTP